MRIEKVEINFLVKKARVRAGAQASVLTIDTNSALSFFMQQDGDIGPTAPYKRRAIHFEFHGRFAKKEQHVADLLLVLLGSSTFSVESTAPLMDHR